MHCGVMTGHLKPEFAVSMQTWTRLHKLAKFSCPTTMAPTRGNLGKQQHHLHMTVRFRCRVQPLETPVDAAQTSCNPARHSRQRSAACS